MCVYDGDWNIHLITLRLLLLSYIGEKTNFPRADQKFHSIYSLA